MTDIFSKVDLIDSPDTTVELDTMQYENMEVIVLDVPIDEEIQLDSFYG